MKKFIFTLSLVLLGFVAQAQDTNLKPFKQPLFTTPNTLQNNTASNVWFEIVVPIRKTNQLWTDARGEQLTETGGGIGFNINWELFGKRATERDSLAKNLLRSIGFQFSGIIAEDTKWEDYGDKVFVKHTGSSFAVGGYVPLVVAQRLILNFGALARRHNALDSMRTNPDDKDTSNDPLRTGNNSLATFVRVAYRVGPAEFGVAYERSFKGFDYKALRSSIGFRW